MVDFISQNPNFKSQNPIPSEVNFKDEIKNDEEFFWVFIL